MAKDQDKSDLRDLTPSELQDWLARQGHPAYRLDQIMDWLYRRPVHEFAAMKTLPRELRAGLARDFVLNSIRELRRQVSNDGSVKSAYALCDNAVIESVWMPEKNRATLCVSSQAGCRMACAFCRTGQAGFVRNLKPSEIAAQVLAAREAFGRVTNIVFMGMGEPLDNLENLLAALAIICDRRGLAFPPRKITVSTIGLAAGIEALAQRAPSIKLAISLHSAVPSTRQSLLRAARISHQIHQRAAGAPTRDHFLSDLSHLKTALQRYPLPPRSRLTIEMVMISGVNDSPAEARALSRFLAGLRAKVNLIPLNPCPGSEFQPPRTEDVLAFQKILKDKNIETFIRQSRGQDILAACGQLRGEIEDRGKRNEET